MKTLILILALACSAQAQWITVQDWKDYRAECRKDSGVLFITLKMGKQIGAYSFEATRDTTWTHRTPTFDGFMEWMEKKPEPVILDPDSLGYRGVYLHRTYPVMPRLVPEHIYKSDSLNLYLHERKP